MATVQECDGVVSLRGLFEDHNSAYFVMDHCTGGDLEQLVQVRVPTVSGPSWALYLVGCHFHMLAISACLTLWADQGAIARS